MARIEQPQPQPAPPAPGQDSWIHVPPEVLLAAAERKRWAYRSS